MKEIMRFSREKTIQIYNKLKKEWEGKVDEEKGYQVRNVKVSKGKSLDDISVFFEFCSETILFYLKKRNKDDFFFIHCVGINISKEKADLVRQLMVESFFHILEKDPDIRMHLLYEGQRGIIKNI